MKTPRQPPRLPPRQFVEVLLSRFEMEKEVLQEIRLRARALNQSGVIERESYQNIHDAIERIARVHAEYTGKISTAKNESSWYEWRKAYAAALAHAVTSLAQSTSPVSLSDVPTPTQMEHIRRIRDAHPQFQNSQSVLALLRKSTSS